MDWAWLPDCGFGDEAVEDGLRGGADVVAALGMPLDAKDEVDVWIVRILAAFDGLDDGVLWTAGGDTETVARDADGLMVAGVDRKAEEVVLFRGFGRDENGPEERFRRDSCAMSDRDLASSRVVDRKRVEILNQGTATPNVEDLDAEADG